MAVSCSYERISTIIHRLIIGLLVMKVSTLIYVCVYVSIYIYIYTCIYLDIFESRCFTSCQCLLSPLSFYLRTNSILWGGSNVATLTSRPYYSTHKYFKSMFVYILLHVHELSFYKVAARGRSISTNLFFYAIYP